MKAALPNMQLSHKLADSLSKITHRFTILYCIIISMCVENIYVYSA